MKVFEYKGHRYARILPSPSLYKSKMIREVTNRGSIFAVNINTMQFTILPGHGHKEVLDVAIRKMPLATPKKQLTLDL